MPRSIDPIRAEQGRRGTGVVVAFFVIAGLSLIAQGIRHGLFHWRESPGAPVAIDIANAAGPALIGTMLLIFALKRIRSMRRS